MQHSENILLINESTFWSIAKVQHDHYWLGFSLEIKPNQ
jgi:hypothetical protein